MLRPTCVISVCLSFIVAFSWQTPPARADVRLPRVLSDHAVLQRDRPISIWGWAAPGEIVTVTLAENNTAKATADEKGNWRVKLSAMPAGGPHKMTAAGKNTVTVQDVLVGEVWICFGQSNMQLAVNASQFGGRDIPKSADPQFRIGNALMVASRPQTDVNIGWVECNPGTIPKFSAVAYYFGKALREKLNVPVGIIHESAGAIPIESFTPLAGLEAVPSQAKIAKIAEQMATDYRKLREKSLSAWLDQARDAIANDTVLPPLPPVDQTIVQRGWSPTGLYNGGVYPLIPFGIRGAVMYQGEANNGQGMVYFEKLQALIGGWRKAWGQGDFPFLFVQLAPWSGYPEGNVEGIWEAQRAALSIPNTGMAVTTDLVPNIADIHPNQKMEVGQRLALWALATVYGQDKLVHSGPLFRSAAIEGDKIRVQFDHAGSGLTTRDDKALSWFQVGTPDGFTDAEAIIEGDYVLVFNKQVPHPQFVRFGWKNTAQPNLINKEGLPASPFRTDCSPVKFSTGSKFAKHKKIQLTTDPVKGVIRYTLDGSTPTEQSPVYSAPLNVDKTTTVSARLFAGDGRSSLTTKATYTKVDPVTQEGKSFAPGLDYDFYAGRWVSTPDFKSLQVDASGTIDGLTPVTFPESFMAAHRLHGYLDIPTAGEYTFTLKSHGGAQLLLDDKLVVDDEGFHGPAEKRGEPIKLTAGKHSLVINYHEGGGPPNIVLLYEGPGISKQEVPASAYFRQE